MDLQDQLILLLKQYGKILKDYQLVEFDWTNKFSVRVYYNFKTDHSFVSLLVYCRKKNGELYRRFVADTNNVESFYNSIAYKDFVYSSTHLKRYFTDEQIEELIKFLKIKQIELI